MRNAVRLVPRLLLGAVVCVLALGFTVGPALAAQPSPERVPAVLQVLAPYADADTPPPTSTTTNVNQQQQAADAALVRRKAVAAVVALVLLVIVYYGHRARNKRRVKASS
jgi:hypothetical protein